MDRGFLMLNVLDNLIPQNTSQEILNILSSNNFPWYGLTLTGYSQDKKINYKNNHIVQDDYYFDESTFEYFQLTHNFYYDNKVNSSYYFIIEELLHSLDLSSYPIHSIVNIKANLQPFYNTDKLYNRPHYDYGRLIENWNNPSTDHYQHKYLVVLYYVNDSDGFTYVFDNHEKPFRIKEKVQSKQGRFLIMDGSYLHAGSHPKTDYRIVINFLFRLENDI